MRNTLRKSALALGLWAATAPMAFAEDVTIGYSVFWGTNPFLVTMVNGAKAAAAEWKDKGYDIDIIVTNGGDTDKSRQVNDLEDLFAQGVDGLLIFPGDSVLVGEPISNLYNDSNLPVVVTDIGVRKGKIASLVITDNLAGGRLAAERMAELLPEGGKVITLDFAPTNDNAQLRQQGFEERAAELGLTVLPEAALPPDMTLENGRRSTEDLLVAEPDIAGMFSFNQVILQGAYTALESGGRVGEVKLVGFDLDPVSYQMVKEGKLDGLVVQDPYAMGKAGLDQVMAVISGGEAQEFIGLDTKLLTPENADDFANDPQVTGK
ncbi:substrate-binding domain-containing protein [Marinovum sp. 2_MG-2023]|uniref:substrate-binding domain-containing protein n=1 Tax=unclassified Marinovum TaxID=2647166 RepID=UPI0026E2C3DF|nr:MULTISPECIES: substrate-binding domain-containing protein [unclassified Marinovum]MDO6731170.1 substrate-binding domain-containing protein [Marinovum sp. 2_MG-2023]MDO6778667.1 substrate-binding domain-containing protein [Marinovum sp. 1_MG-2023]